MSKLYRKNTKFVYRPRNKFVKQKKSSSKRSSSTALFFVALIVLVFSSFLFWKRNFVKEQVATILNPKPREEQQEEVSKETKDNIVSHVIEKGDIPADVFMAFGKLNANDVASLLSAAENIFDFTNLKINKKIDFHSSKETQKLEKIVYYPTSERMVVASFDGEDFEVIKEDIPYIVEEKTTTVAIDEYLYKDALDEGLTAATIVEIADIFSFDVDFTTEIRQGDELKLVYEKRTLDNEEAPDGKVLAAKFTNDGKSHFAYYFKDNDSHYDEDGNELVRQFLRAPLSYRKITSGYTGARLHPITKKVTAHYQIDYAAPVGTPVVATARGTITSAGWAGGWGNMIRMSHDNGYTTHYGHLSGYGTGVKTGASISQGQVIGFVGSTGWSTGPHLDYGMKLNNQPINPLSLQLPKGEPLKGEPLEKFKQEKNNYKDKLN